MIRVFSILVLTVVFSGVIAGCSPKEAAPEKSVPPPGNSSVQAPSAASQNGGAAYGPDGKPLK
ncbi:hypothetical protein [Armatimonas sp.]|uniref:hypothetical protein n=1 Tax=Armatimonas sp. TaxID=1872638 RepID=UPI00374CF048